MSSTLKPIGGRYDLKQAARLITVCDRAAATGNKNFVVGYVHFVNCLRPIILDGKLRPMRGYTNREAVTILN